MIKIGVFSDIHGNCDSLKAVLSALDANKVDCKVCLGDLVGYFHQSIEVIDLMMRSNIPTLMGNHEAYLIGKLKCSPEKWDFISMEYVRQGLTDAQRSWIEHLPLKKEETIAGKRIVHVHGSPWDPLEEYIYPDHKNFERFASLDCDYIFLGHTHYPFIKKVGRCTIVNPGSCGEPRQGDHRACAVVFDDKKGSVEQLHIDYDLKSFIAGARKFGIPEKVIHVLERSVK